MDAPRPIDHKNQNQRAPAPSGQYPRTHLRSEPTLTVDPPRDPDYRAFLADVASQLAELEGTPYRLRSYQPTLLALVVDRGIVVVWNAVVERHCRGGEAKSGGVGSCFATRNSGAQNNRGRI